MSFKSESFSQAAQTVSKRMEARGFSCFYCEDKAAIAAKINELMPSGSSVTWGGSESLVEAGIIDMVHSRDYEVIDRKSASTPEEARALYGRIVCADYFLTSTNAFTLDGELVNVDGNGNRVACLISGPSHVIVVASMNKLCVNVGDAIRRIHTHAAPPNAIRVGANTPCSKTGICADCLSPDCICCQTVVTRKSRQPGRIIVILTGEPLGF
ncbi:MAG: lactate utilization protein [Clostridia bacterium]|nr:lactate utilization protein [Clostridia bacterium]NCC42844.1 lactate utilization protein [Clostridia bacterium]